MRARDEPAAADAHGHEGRSRLGALRPLDALDGLEDGLGLALVEREAAREGALARAALAPAGDLVICALCGERQDDRGCYCERTPGEVFMDEVYEVVHDPATGERLFRRREPELGFFASRRIALEAAARRRP